MWRDAIVGAGAVVVLASLFVAETRAPLRHRVRPRHERLAVNAVVALGAALAVRLAVVPVGLAVAGAAERGGFGLLHWLAAPAAIGWTVGLLLLDYTMYVWHRLNHRVPSLWRFHLVHHTDLDLDVSTALRFHAGELLLSCGWRAAQAAAIGPPIALVIVFEMAFAAATAFHHSNWRLPRALDRALASIIVTPRMHGIHHSTLEAETNSNWSVMFSWWDRLHGTRRLQRAAEPPLVIGIPAYPTPLGVGELLMLPFRRQPPAWPPATSRAPSSSTAPTAAGSCRPPTPPPGAPPRRRDR
jgi:sterol desaturase/sphingolipid hydroxylase (fatty acid hydroxylase superfamily)